MDGKLKRQLELQAYKMRKLALQTIEAAGSGHIGGSFSIAEILSVLYFDEMNVDVNEPKKIDRDRLVLSKGHCSPSLYTALAMKGFFKPEHLATFRKIDSDLSGHVEIHVPGVDMSGGSLGQGLSVALGMAMYGQSRKLGYRVFCIMGDGEIQEGQIWEAAMAAGFYRVDNLIAFVDNNKLQLDGSLEEVMSPYPIGEKFRAFGWNVMEIDGSDIEQIHNVIELASSTSGKPTVIVADTVKDFLRGNCPWNRQLSKAMDLLEVHDAGILKADRQKGINCRHHNGRKEICLCQCKDRYQRAHTDDADIPKLPDPQGCFGLQVVRVNIHSLLHLQGRTARAFGSGGFRWFYNYSFSVPASSGCSFPPGSAWSAFCASACSIRPMTNSFWLCPVSFKCSLILANSSSDT